MMTEIVQGLVLTYIEASCCSKFFGTFLPSRFPDKRWMNQALVVTLTLLLTVISVFLMGQPVIKAVAVVGIIAIIISISFECDVKQVLFFSSTFYGIVMAIDGGLLVAVRYVFGDEMSMDPLHVTVLAILCKSFLLLSVIIRRRFAKEHSCELPENQEWILFLFFPIFTVTAVLLFFVEEGGGGRAVLLVSFGLVVASLILFYMLWEFVARSRQAYEASLMQERAKNKVELYESMESAYNEQKDRVHEFMNHVDCIQVLLSEDDKEGMSMVLMLGKLDGIKIENEDLVVLLSNLLDNAIEACRKLEEQEKMICLRFVQDGDQNVIATKNPPKDHVEITDGKIATTKGNKLRHGIGLSNVKRVVVKAFQAAMMDTSTTRSFFENKYSEGGWENQPSFFTPTSAFYNVC